MFWLLHIYGDVEPQAWMGPFRTWEVLVAKAREVRAIEDLDGLYWCTSEEKPKDIAAFTGGVLDK